MSKLKTLAELKAAWAAGNYWVDAEASCDASDLVAKSHESVAGAINVEVKIGDAPTLLFQTNSGDSDTVSLVTGDTNHFDDFLAAVDDADEDIDLEDVFPGIEEKAQAAFTEALSELKGEIEELKQESPSNSI
ncbi:MAG: hypothetical protein ING69_10580 [Rhodocyclaceae bacterium]|nr:hypothetical protein [Rhodocyclaceae bacterium]